ncbi:MULTISPECIES: DUF4190 domain-containing protein [Streptomyces]|uniref:DUF4190 domain-containing protein n=1 Tax=Streptomyces lichenis TaxID=2306967 RepID=A0ABT0IDQ6_9ACTN|nr:DUF4190 domain-containing protein [Streptomyces lichenis]MCK8679463.1 DUF4190 domain-containing protein [Streptomyces lichenis]
MELTRPNTASTSTARARRRFDANGMAVASFVLGLVGLLVMNLVLGPIAIGLAVLALRRGTVRRTRAFLGLGLGVADLVVLAIVMSTSDGSAWSIA